MTFEDLKQNNLKMNGIPAWRNSLRQFCVHCSDDDGTRVDIGRVDAFARFHQRVVRWRGPQLVAGGWRRQGAGRGHRGGLVHRRVAGTPARRENGLSANYQNKHDNKGGGGISIIILLAQSERLYLSKCVLPLSLPQMAWLGFFLKSNATTWNRTHVGSVAPLFCDINSVFHW